MSKMKFLFSLLLAASVLMVQAGGAIAAPALQSFPPISGAVQSITLETDSATGIITVIVGVLIGDQTTQEVRISQKAAEKLGLVVPDADGKPVINKSTLGQSVEIKLTMVVPNDEGERHPVANALEAFFSDIEGLDYNLIMDQHEAGLGFGVIAQALWLTRQIGGDAKDFQDLILAKQSNDYSNFSGYLLEDGTSPTNWGQLRKAILRTNKKDNSTIVVSDQNDGVINKDKSKDKEKDKGNDKTKSNNGNSNKP